MEITWKFADNGEERYFKKMFERGRAYTKLQKLVFQKKSKDVGEAKLSYIELGNLLQSLEDTLALKDYKEHD